MSNRKKGNRPRRRGQRNSRNVQQKKPAKKRVKKHKKKNVHSSSRVRFKNSYEFGTECRSCDVRTQEDPGHTEIVTCSALRRMVNKKTRIRGDVYIVEVFHILQNTWLDAAKTDFLISFSNGLAIRLQVKSRPKAKKSHDEYHKYIPCIVVRKNTKVKTAQRNLKYFLRQILEH